MAGKTTGIQPILQPFVGRCVSRACTRFSLGALFLGLLLTMIVSLLLRQSALDNRARVCMCAMLFGGVDRATIEHVLGLSRKTVLVELGPLVKEGLLTRHRTGSLIVRYHATQSARKLVRAELRRLRLEGEVLVNELRQHSRVKQDRLDRLLGLVPDVE